MIDKIFGVYKKIVRGICFIFEIVAGVSLISMLVVILIHVVSRYFFNSATSWGEEIARQLMVVFAFIGIALGVRDKLHISLSVFTDTFLKKITLPIEIFNKIIIVILGFMMSFYMGSFFERLRYNRLPATGIPVGYIYVVPTAVGIMISLLAIYQVYDHFKHGTDEEQKRHKEKGGEHL